jgi:hypothetical protein
VSPAHADRFSGGATQSAIKDAPEVHPLQSWMSDVIYPTGADLELEFDTLYKCICLLGERQRIFH